MMKSKSKKELLDHYATRDPVTFYQLDGFADGAMDDMGGSDEDGDAVYWGVTQELMTGVYNVRVLVTDGTPDAAALRLLRKILAGIEEHTLGWFRAEAAEMGEPPIAVDEVCPRCGAFMQTTHHSLCQYPDGTPTELPDETVRQAIEILQQARVRGRGYNSLGDPAGELPF